MVLVGEQQLHLLVEVRLVVGQVLVLDMGELTAFGGQLLAMGKTMPCIGEVAKMEEL